MAPLQLLGLLLATVATTAAAFLSMRQLRLAAPLDVYWALVLADVSLAPIGFLMSTRCSVHLQGRAKACAVCLAGAVMLPMLACTTVVALRQHAQVSLLNWACLGTSCYNSQAHSPLLPGRALAASAGMAAATGLHCFLIQCAFGLIMVRAEDFEKLNRRLCRLWEPKPQVSFCEDLEAEAPGECAICLEMLAETSRCGAAEAEELLRLPCRHTFHAACVERWMDEEVACPLCRCKVGHGGQCTRLLRTRAVPLRVDAADAPVAQADQDSLRAEFPGRPGCAKAPLLAMEES